MDVSRHLNLHPRQVARSLHDIEGWRLPETEDLLGLQRGVSRMLSAMQQLCELEVPVVVQAHKRDAMSSDLDEGEALFGLLGAAEEALDSDPHRLRIEHIAKQSPGHALQLEDARRRAIDHVRAVRMRLDFIWEGLDSLDEPPRIRERGAVARVLQ